mmetsp:Transcript_9917/g.28159  ORF Transcript_9917/g.28159 Transcript_9917/m.28159 type:complete len:229 (-) Transcript_9917:481-1167(-)
MFSTQAMPSSSALCASMGPAITSPIAKMEGTLVAKCSSTTTRPRRSVSMPSSSRPRPPVNGRRPMETRHTSVSSSSVLPFLTFSRESLTPSPVTSEPATLVPSLNFMPCFLQICWNFLAISVSTPGKIRSRNSTTVTSAPRRRQTEPISRPITPAPTTTIFLGTSLSSRAPVESTMRPPALSTGTGGSGVDSEPVAIKMFFDSTSWAPPSTRSTDTEFGPVILPWPLR